MLFLVPDQQDAPAPSANGGRAGGLGDDQDSTVKVELDLDDAPFLNEPDEEETPPNAPEPKAPQEEKPEPDQESPKKGLLANKKKLFILIIALALIVSGIGGALFFFLSAGDEAPNPEQGEKKRVVVITSQPGEEMAPAAQVVDLKPFIIPSKGSEGEARLLRCTLRIPYEDDIQRQELEVRRLEVRDAIYYYLVNKPLVQLITDEEADLLKQDIVNVVNELLTLKKINNIYIQEYVITTP